MREIKLGSVQFTESNTSTTPYLIGTFGAESTGKTRFPLTGPEVIGFIPLERKSYATIMKDAAELGKRVWQPKDPESLIVNMRKAKLLGTVEGKAKTQSAMEEEENQANDRMRAYYRECADRIYDAIYAMLENQDIRTVVIDTGTQFYNIIDSAIYGFKTKYIKIKSQTYQDRREYNQEIIDFLNSLASYKKHVIITHRQKDEYKNDKVWRKTFEGFKFLGNYTSILVQHESNPNWNPTSDDESKLWHYALTVRTCQNNPNLEGEDYKRFLLDDQISFVNLLMAVDPNIDPESIM
jgi:hypothetical protein